MNHRLGLRFALTLSFAAALAGCGEDSVSLNDLANAYEDAYCSRLVRCGRYVDAASCKEALQLSTAEILASVNAGRTAYDGDKAAACLDALRGASCDVTDADNRADVPACEEIFRGTVADGGVCFDDDECLSDSCSIPDCGMACCAGVCDPTVAITPPAAIGQSCLQVNCVDGAFCDDADICIALLPVGSQCDGGGQCTYGLYCSESGTCADAPGRGQPCPDGECSDIGDRCDTAIAVPTCVALAKRGEACPPGSAGLFACQSPLRCSETAMICEAPPAVGAACTFFCAAGAFCNDADVCEAIKADGQPCTSSNECGNDSFCDLDLTTPVCVGETVCGV